MAYQPIVTHTATVDGHSFKFGTPPGLPMADLYYHARRTIGAGVDKVTRATGDQSSERAV